MNSSKLHEILKYFTKIERNRLRKFIVSPYFNRSEALVQLFDLVSTQLDSGTILEKEQVWQEINANTPFDDVRYRKYVSDLLKLIEDYFAQEVFEENPLYKANFLMTAAGRRKLTKLYNKAIRTAERITETSENRSAEHYYQRYISEKNLHVLKQFDQKRLDISNVETIAKNLDHFYMAEKLRLYCNILSRQYESSHKYSLLYIDEILHKIRTDKPAYKEVPPVAIYFQISEALTDSEQESHYFDTRILLDQYGLSFPKDEAFELYTYAINYCVRKINKGNQKFLREYFELYRDLLKKGILLVDGELPTAHFKNIVIVGLRLGETKWTEQFIHEQNQFLPEHQRENAVSFNLAQLYFYKKDYNKVIETLRSVEYEDLSYNLNSKTFLLTTYYELDEIEPLYSLLDTFRVYLQRQKNITSRRRRSYLNLIRFVKRLTRIIPGEKKELAKIKADLEQTPDVVSASWLREKIAELE
jgi:hypothetical protein